MTNVPLRPRPRWLLAAVAAALLAVPAAAGAQLTTWGSDLSATPNADTANGATNTNPAGTGSVILPNPHDGQDTSVFNTTVAGGAAVAPQGGQGLKVTIKGCAVRDPAATSQQSADGTGGFQPVNAIEFIVVAPDGHGGWTDAAVAGMFRLPFCGDASPSGAPYSATSLTTFSPIHMCLAAGDAVALHDLGGFVPGPGPGYYPQGVPLKAIYQPKGAATASATASYVGQSGAFGPPVAPRGATSGYAVEPGQELMLQVTEGTGEDAYGLCPGGRAVEPSTSNAIVCVSGGASAEGYPMCDGAGRPMYAPVNTRAPALTGIAQVGYALIMSHGTWASTPYGYSYQWQRCDGSGAACQDIPGATASTYHPTTADVGRRVRIGETATNPAGSGGPAYSSPSAVIVAATVGGAGSAPTASTTPALSRLTVAIHHGRVTVHYRDSLRATTTITVLTVARHPRRVLRVNHRDLAVRPTTVTLAKLRRGRYTLQMQSVLDGHRGRRVKRTLTIR